jgi:hypothetical protein
VFAGHIHIELLDRARRRWAALASRLRTANVRGHYSARLIQSAWCQAAGKRVRPNLTQYFRLPLAAFQEAEWRTLTAVADKITGDSLDAVIGRAVADKEEEN